MHTRLVLCAYMDHFDSYVKRNADSALVKVLGRPFDRKYFGRITYPLPGVIPRVWAISIVRSRSPV